jgi:hypothetical protein
LIEDIIDDLSGASVYMLAVVMAVTLCGLMWLYLGPLDLLDVYDLLPCTSHARTRILNLTLLC